MPWKQSKLPAFIDPWEAFKSGRSQAFEADINDYLTVTLGSIATVSDGLARKYPEYPIMISDMPDVGKLSLILQNLRNFVHEADKYLSKTIDHGEFVAMVGGYSEQLRTLISDYESWRVGAKKDFFRCGGKYPNDAAHTNGNSNCVSSLASLAGS